MGTSILRRCVLATCLAAVLLPAVQAQAQAPAISGDTLILDAREALRRGDRARLTALSQAAARAEHPLAMWPDYWQLRARLNEATVAEVEAFYERWRGSYVEDRLRNDWLLELGRRRDWAAFERDLPRFRMNDDREVSCYALLVKHLAGQGMREAAREAWMAQRDADNGCNLLAGTLREAGVLRPHDVWRKLMQSVDQGRPRAAQAAAALIGPDAAKAVAEIFDSPARYLSRRTPGPTAGARQLGALAIMRMAANDPAAARLQLDQPWVRNLDRHWEAALWGSVARQAALRHQPDAVAMFQRALAVQGQDDDTPELSDETLAWAVRAALRSASGDERWNLITSAVDAMSLKEQLDPAWVYWKARALRARAATGEAGHGGRAAANRLMETIASPLHFYGKLATEDLERSLALPVTPAPLSAAERDAALAHPGLSRALQLMTLGLRGEGVREWNYSLIGMSDRELLAAAQRACEREVWDRCINTSERTRAEVDLTQRFPTPFRQEVLATAREVGVDAATVYGLIRQESRFVTDARSHVGAAGLMQVMPGTARWTAKRIGFDWNPAMSNDRAINLRLGMTYLKLVLDDFEGSAPMATAAYNAGPGRSRRWREGPTLEPAAWAETIPFNETRDYVKKVLSNATLYAALMKTAPAGPPLRSRLGSAIGPRAAAVPEPNKELP
jgi:soluble lytic murein transglycosylase